MYQGRTQPLSDHNTNNLARVSRKHRRTTLSRHDFLVEEQKFAVGPFTLGMKLVIDDWTLRMYSYGSVSCAGIRQVRRKYRGGYHMIAGRGHLRAQRYKGNFVLA